VSRRTLFRDLDLLRDAGIPVEYDEASQSYLVRGERFLPPTNFTPDEALALVVLCHELGDGRQLPFYRSAGRAARKIESTLPRRLRDQLHELSRVVQIELPVNNRLDEAEPVYRKLVLAIAQHRAVRIHYDSFADQQHIGTKLFAYRLLFSRRSWYVIGRSSLHRAVRTFNVGRILELTPLDEHYRIPRRFSLKRYLRNAWHLIPEPGPDYKVRIRFRPWVARNVAEVSWHATQKLQFARDGSLDFRVTVSGLGEISWWILGYGDQAIVLQPPELREIVIERAARLLGHYNHRVTIPSPRYIAAQQDGRITVRRRSDLDG